MLEGSIIKKYREQSNLTIEELAEACSLPVKLLEKVERNEHKLNSEDILKVMYTLNIQDKVLSQELWYSEVTTLLGDKVRVLRENKGLTLDELATLTELSPTYISEIERKNTVPSPSTLRRLAEVLGVPVSTFLGNKRKNTLVVEKLVNFRKQLGWSQKDLAKKAGVSPGLIGQIESSKVQVSLKTLEKLATAMNISPCYLLLEQGEIDAVITAMCPELREMLYEPQVQMTIGQICTMSKDQLNLVFNFINMIKNNG